MDLDLAALALSSRNRYPTVSFPTADGGKMPSKLSHYLTVPGNSYNPSHGSTWTQIYEQNPSIVCYTCGNMVGSTRDVATIFYDLLAPRSNHSLVSEASLSEMT